MSQFFALGGQIIGVSASININPSNEHRGLVSFRMDWLDLLAVQGTLKGLDLIDRVPDELWNEVRDSVQETGSRPSPWKRNAKKKNGCLGRPYK